MIVCVAYNKLGFQTEDRDESYPETGTHCRGSSHTGHEVRFDGSVSAYCTPQVLQIR